MWNFSSLFTDFSNSMYLEFNYGSFIFIDELNFSTHQLQINFRVQLNGISGTTLNYRSSFIGADIFLNTS